MVHDRGSIKWTSLMLPEHVELLKHIWKEDKIIARPELDEQELELLNRKILQAYRDKLLISIEHYHNGQMRKTIGKIKKIDQMNHAILLDTPNKDTISIQFNNIYHLI